MLCAGNLTTLKKSTNSQSSSLLANDAALSVDVIARTTNRPNCDVLQINCHTNT